MLRKGVENKCITLEKLLKREEAAGGDVHQEGAQSYCGAGSEKPSQIKSFSSVMETMWKDLCAEFSQMSHTNPLFLEVRYRVYIYLQFKI